MDTNWRPRGVHLVGSVPLANADEVFRTVSGLLGPHIKRIPDGETGERATFLRWQYAKWASIPQLEPSEATGLRVDPNYGSKLKLRPGADAGEIGFGRLGYADSAIGSYKVFADLKREGVLPAGCRFQVCLPPPISPINYFLALESQLAVEPVYEAHLLREVEEVLAEVPHDQLAFQWDASVEIAMWEGLSPSPFSNVKEGISERLSRIGDGLPNDVQLGYHLCYGDRDHRHFMEPKDLSNLVELANILSARINRRIDWVHMTVPQDRTDNGYFAPLAELAISPQTDLYLGLVHYIDGVEGTKRRIKTARKYVDDFGIATACGLGRRPLETIPELLRIHVETAGGTF